MLKFLVILFIVGYVTYKLGGFLMNTLYSIMGQEPPQRNFNQKSSKKKKGDVNIDYVPNSKKNKSDFRGGEYVDYEDVQ